MHSIFRSAFNASMQGVQKIKKESLDDGPIMAEKGAKSNGQPGVLRAHRHTGKVREAHFMPPSGLFPVSRWLLRN